MDEAKNHMLLADKFHNSTWTPGLLGPILAVSISGVLSGILVGVTVLGPVVSPPEGIPCLDRHFMCAPDINHSPDDLHKETQSLPDSVATRTASPITLQPNQMRLLK